MVIKQVYLTGGMTGLSFEESNAWRNEVKNWIGESCKLINPNTYYNFEHEFHDTEKEVRNFDLSMVRKSDLIIVNFNSPQSIGTAQELAVAYEYRIPVIGLNSENKELHPWLIECCDKMFSEMSDLLDYVQYYYLG